MRTPILLCAAALFAAPLKADKFWLGDPDKQTVEGSAPDVIEGVLIDENATSYHIRVVGGEIVLSKKQVVKVEKDDLTLAKLLDAEQVERERLAKVEERQALDRAAERLKREVQAAEAAATRAPATVVEPVVVPTAPVAAVGPAGLYDPVVGRNVAAYSHMQLLDELELAWSLTKDRRYLVALRRLRRLH